MDSHEAYSNGMKNPAGYNHPKLYLNKSKDNLTNGKISTINQTRTKTNSRVPKVVKIPTILYYNKPSSDKVADNKMHNSGDRLSNSRTIQFLTRKDVANKSKASHIPRRKIIVKETASKEKPLTTTSKRKTPQVYIERNVQRVQMLINQDYRPEEHIRMESVARPIPNLALIHGRSNQMESANISDWFVNLNAPANSLASNYNLNRRQASEMKNNVGNADVRTKVPHKSDCSGLGLSTPQTYSITTANKNSDWTMSDVEYPTRDNESGYRSLSPSPKAPRTRMQDVMQSNSIFNLKESTSARIDRLIRRATCQQEDKPEKESSTVTQQSTMVLAKITSSMLLKNLSNATDKIGDNDINKMTHNSSCLVMSKQNDPVPSYEECPSELLQKTTNFEIDCSTTTPNSLSSITGTDLEIRDDISSQCTLDHEDGSICDAGSAIEWCDKCGKPQIGRSKKEFFSETTSMAESVITNLNEDLFSDIDASIIKDSVFDLKPFEEAHYRRWKKHKSLHYCEKCHKYKRFPSCRFKELSTFSSFRRRISIRICRRRLSRVWKKTTERWALWSAKPPQRFKKHRMMKYLQRNVTSEEAHAQTNMNLVRERGTDSVPKEKKSQAITAILNKDSYINSFTSYRSETGTTATLSPFTKCKMRNCNIGPSMFPLFYNNAERNSLIKHKIQCTPIHGNFKETKNTPETDVVAAKTEDLQTTKSLLEDALHEMQTKEVREQSEESIHICEVSVDDKVTDTKEVSQMREEVTSTILHSDAIRAVATPRQNVATQMEHECHDAGTDWESTLVRINLPRSTGTCTSSHCLASALDNTQMMFIPIAPIRTLAAATKNKEFIDAENGHTYLLSKVGMSPTVSVLSEHLQGLLDSFKILIIRLMVLNPNLKNGVCITPPVQICQCPILVPRVSCGTDTNDITTNEHSKSTTKLRTYVNTGMLLNTIVEQAVLRGSPRFSIVTETKSIGNKNTSDIGICTNTTLTDSVIETEKGSKNLSANTNTFMTQESKFTEQNSSFATEDGKRFENATQYSREGEKDSEVSQRLCEGIGQSYLMSIRTLSRSVEEVEAQTEIAFPDNGARLLEVLAQKKHTSVSTSCNPDEIKSPIAAFIASKMTKDTDNTNIEKKIEMMEKISNSNIDSRKLNEAVLSSALDAVKWIKAGFQVEMERANNNAPTKTNIQTLDHTTSCSGAAENVNVLKNEPIVVTENTVDYDSTRSNKDGVSALTYEMQDKRAIAQMIDEVTSDLLMKDVEEKTFQASPQSCDAATECFRENGKKSASALTSRCVLPGLPYYYCENHRCGELSGDCRFVYDLPRCIIHSRKPEAKAIKKEPTSVKMDPYKSVRKPPHDSPPDIESRVSLDGTNNSASMISQPEVIQKNNALKSFGVMECCCKSKINMNKQSVQSNDSETTGHKSPHPLTKVTTLGGCCDPPLYKSQTKPTSTANSPAFEKTNTTQQLVQTLDFLPKITSRKCKPSTSQGSKGRYISTDTSVNEAQFSRNIGMGTTKPIKPSLYQQTSHLTSATSNATSINQQDVKQTIGLNTSSYAQPTCQKHTSNIHQTMTAKTSVKEPLDRAVSVNTSRQNSPPIHDKACSNIIKYASGTTSMYDEMNTESVGLVNSSYEKEHTLTAAEEQCVQSVGIITSAWKSSPTVRASDLSFLLSPKEYEALYKTTRLLTKEAAKAAIKEENSESRMKHSSQADAAVEVLLKAEVQSAQNMVTPSMRSETVMAAPAQFSAYTVHVAPPDPELRVVGTNANLKQYFLGVPNAQAPDSSGSSSVYDSNTSPSCSANYPLVNMEIPTRDSDISANESTMKTNLAASCRYYSSLLTKHLDNVKDNLTKRLASSDGSNLPTYMEACTMKPSAREEFGCQTFKTSAKEKVLDPSVNETDICRHDKEHLQSVYYMLTAIEGRLRRLKSSVDSYTD